MGHTMQYRVDFEHTHQVSKAVGVTIFEIWPMGKKRFSRTRILSHDMRKTVFAHISKTITLSALKT